MSTSTKLPMLSIDFGNSYTKVAIREDRNKKTAALTEASLKYDDDHICVPTLAARSTETSGREQWFYGNEVVNLQESARLRVFRNWKPNFFKGVAKTPLEEISDNERDRSASPWDDLSTQQLQNLLKSGVLTGDQRDDIRSILESRRPEEIDFERMAQGYFGWLLSFVEPVCINMGLGAVADIPVRITLPSFGVHAAKARLQLVNILQRAGWRPDDKPALPEPIANMLGIFSEGRNFTMTPRPIPSMPDPTEGPNWYLMFRNSMLYKALRAVYDGRRSDDRKVFWAMVVDLGGYTTDFGMVGINLENVDEPIEGKYQGRPRKADHSEPLGVTDLDKRIRSALMPANRDGFDHIISVADPQRLDRFHQLVYQDGRPYNTGLGWIGVEPSEKAGIQHCISTFSSEVAAYAKHFCLLYQYDRIDELILTGGGCNIPEVRDAVVAELFPVLAGRAHVPAAEGDSLSPKCTPLDRVMVRGATAIGAASVIFDYPTSIA